MTNEQSYSATKKLLLGNLADVFISRGYDGATLTNLANAVGISKASLYHHFPGGKPEMAGALIRSAIADLHRLAFAKLSSRGSPAEQLDAFVTGFSEYTDNGTRNCLLAILTYHNTASDQDVAAFQQIIATQFQDWHGALTEVFQAGGAKPKRAKRRAYDLLSRLYGALLVARLHNNPDLYLEAVKQIRRNIKPQRS